MGFLLPRTLQLLRRTIPLTGHLARLDNRGVRNGARTEINSRAPRCEGERRMKDTDHQVVHFAVPPMNTGAGAACGGVAASTWLPYCG
jgi:hypothetical protein